MQSDMVVCGIVYCSKQGLQTEIDAGTSMSGTGSLPHRIRAPHTVVLIGAIWFTVELPKVSNL